MLKISIVIPCRNEVQYIQECIEHIYASENFNQWEVGVYIVDGMSDDGTREKIQSLLPAYKGLQLVDNEKQLTPFAFNLGIHAGGKVDFVQIIGARHMVSPNYLQLCIEKLESDASTWCVGGRIENEYINDEGRIIAHAMSTSFGMGLGNFRTLNESGYTDTVTSPMYPYWVFEKIGFFDEELIRNQDDDFNFRVSKAGGRIFFENRISLRYYVRGTFNGLWRQFFQYGYWKVYVNKKHKAVTTIRQMVPPAFVAYMLSLLPMALVLPSLLFDIYFLGCLAYVLLMGQNAWKLSNQHKESFFQYCQTFLILHFSYGLGYLKGIQEFLILGKKPSQKQKRLSR
ncbi:MAG: glycosyltransferase family 2 protein [Crocinitomicaceae bacterium]|jgi:GT2 family glycosyltransferase|nr:glycosyltransferase family 2 protein [Crocinitomicaceae bacterium]